MTKTITMPVSSKLIKDALEYYWREQTTIKDHEEVKLVIPEVEFKATITILADKGVESKLEHGKDG